MHARKQSRNLSKYESCETFKTTHMAMGLTLLQSAELLPCSGQQAVCSDVTLRTPVCMNKKLTKPMQLTVLHTVLQWPDLTQTSDGSAYTYTCTGIDVSILSCALFFERVELHSS